MTIMVSKILVKQKTRPLGLAEALRGECVLATQVRE
jgi:hypothetical protein